MSRSMEKDVKVTSDEAFPYSRTDSLPPYTKRPINELTSNITSPVPDLISTPSQLLTIQARGIGSMDLSCYNSELTIPIFAGTDTHAQALYISTRASRKKGNAVLSHVQDGDIISTAYKFGPFREPKLHYLQNQQSLGNDVKHSDGSQDENDEASLAVEVKSACGFTNSVVLTSIADPSRVYKWKYTRTKTTMEGKLRVMALFDESASSSKGGGEAIAVLVRSDSTRTPGTSRWGQGNGGQLYINSNADPQMDEGLVVATCIMMLKKEIDRGRAASGAAVGAAGSS